MLVDMINQIQRCDYCNLLFVTATAEMRCKECEKIIQEGKYEYREGVSENNICLT